MKLGHVRSKTRSPCQMLEKLFVPSRGHSVDLKIMKLSQKVIIIINRSGSKLDQIGSKTRSLGQILEKPYVHSRGHSFDSKFMKLCQNTI